jgi:hypothetical protein
MDGGAIRSQGFELKSPTPPPRLSRWAAHAAHSELSCLGVRMCVRF